MAGQTPNFLAGGDIRVMRFVKQDTSADNQVLEADTNERVIGISQEGGREAPLPSVTTNYAAQSGEPIHVYGPGEQCLLTLGSGGCAAGDRLKSDTDGNGVSIATTGVTKQFAGARALSAGNAGEAIRVLVEIWEGFVALS